MRVAILTTDNREHHRKYELMQPYFGPAIEAVLQGLQKVSSLEVHVICCTQQPMTAPEKLAANVWFHLLEVPKIGWMRTGYQGCVRAIRRRVRALGPDIVHGEGTERECALAAVFSGIPNVVTIHGNMRAVAAVFDAKIGSYLWCAARLESLAIRRTGGVLCNSAYTESLVVKQAKRIWRVPNALRREFFDTPSPPVRLQNTPILLNVGSIDVRKRQNWLLRLARKLHENGHVFELQIVGTGPGDDAYSREFRDRIEHGEKCGYARYLGSKSLIDIIGLFDHASALIHVPLEEAFGLVVAEALSRNLKFFGMDVGGISDIAYDVEGVELFSPGDEQQLEAAIAWWLQAGCPRPESAAAEMSARYHPDVIAAAHLKIYHAFAGRLATRH